MSRLRIIGLGSPFGADQLGFEVIKLLQHSTRLEAPDVEAVEMIIADRPGMRLLELMAGAETVFLIDAVQSEAREGSLHHFYKEAIESLQSPTSSHSLGVAEAIKMGKILGELPQRLEFYGIEIKSIPGQSELPDPIKLAINQLVRKIEDAIVAFRLYE